MSVLGRCLHYRYPDLVGYPFVPGVDGYVYVDQERQNVALYPDQNVTTELGTRGMAHLNPDQVRDAYFRGWRIFSYKAAYFCCSKSFR